MHRQLRIQGKHYDMIKDHLFPGDGMEAVAVILCGRHRKKDREILTSYQVILIPYEECERDPEYVSWKIDRVIPFFEQVEKKNLALVKIHCHPGGTPWFSKVDDESDAAFFKAAFSWSETEDIHASAVMLPNGEIFGRAFLKDLSSVGLDRITVAGDNVLICDKEKKDVIEEFALRTIQAFGDGTYRKLRSLRVGIVGCSGTGSPVIEQLIRLGVGELVIIDPDEIESKNLNRVLNSGVNDIGKAKVLVMKEAIADIGLPTVVTSFDVNLLESRDAQEALVSCDIIFGCVDSVEGRYLMSQLSNFYVIPYFDLGVRLIANGKGGITTVVGSVNYIQPGMSSLMSRHVIARERLESEGLKRKDPEYYSEQLEQKYISGVNVDSPAVISVNMVIASNAVLEFLDKLHGFKEDRLARVMVDMVGGCVDNSKESEFAIDPYAEKWAGRGDCKPFLQMPSL